MHKGKIVEKSDDFKTVKKKEKMESQNFGFWDENQNRFAKQGPQSLVAQGF